MQQIPTTNTAGSSLRFIFGGEVVSRDYPVGATLGDVAWTLRGLSSQRYGKPLAIDMTIPAAAPPR